MTSYDLKRKSNEEFEDYHVRLFEDMSIHELDSDEVAELLNREYGVNYSESKWRKDYAQYAKWKDYILSKHNNDTELDKLTIKKLELQKERNKLSSEKNELNKWIREQARTENIYEKIEQAIANLSSIQVPKVEIKENNNKRTAIIDIADSHFGREGKITGFNNEVLAEYSVDIFKRRMWDLLEYAIAIIDKEKLTHVTVLNLSDSIDGLLHMNQLQFQQLGVADQVMQFAEFMSEWLNALSEYVTIDYRSVLGNHSENRYLNSSRGELAQENMERLIEWYIKTRLSSNNRVTVYEAKNIIYFDVLGTKILSAHGQDERNLEVSIKDYMMIYNVPVHLFKTGHLHHGNNKTIGMNGLQNIEFVQSPSICGIDEYSLKLKKTANAGSLITIIEEGYGKLCTYDIRLN
ncbi:hypothetical protein [Lysinibacillus sp. BPa_S21]|uniref:hypothetical protein n=1 Tax=Lysinibacillus sp. BPa_S21 TaxID=2932478 RepID=UPI002010E409|nr:hypothetical protein [Lysinibacillus sp. BPa_S21]MCL1696273.1 hypothetical protein [Lysinibacillus sp. BPa_S21]